MTTEDRVRIEVDDEDDRYHRQSLISWWDQDRLRAARILVIGAGALGNEIVKNLALIGVGRVTVVDMDEIENSNLSRCVFFRPSDEGRKKAGVLAERAAEMNPDVETEALAGDVRLAVGLGRFADCDLVLGGLDNREARLYVNQACWKTGTPWIDGAIEGLMGTVRVFIPPDTACYECTMNERDHQLVAARRSCTLLSREEMIEGKVPTNATTASVIGGIQVQEAVKLLHRDRLGEPSLAGAGFNFVGLTHESYVVRYAPKEDCLSHDTYELAQAERVDPETSLGALLERSRERLGPEAVLELEQEIAVGGKCSACGNRRDLGRPLDALTAADAICPDCGEPWQLEFAHGIEDESPLLKRTAAEIGLPDQDVLVGRFGCERVFFRLDPLPQISEVGA